MTKDEMVTVRFSQLELNELDRAWASSGYRGRSEFVRSAVARQMRGADQAVLQKMEKMDLAISRIAVIAERISICLSGSE